MTAAPAPLRVVLLGPPASGKGTQGRRLAKSLGVAYLSTGSLLRQELAAETELGLKAKPFLDRGEYLPDEIMCPILAAWLACQTGGWVLDGFPRSLPQAEFLDAWLVGNAQSLDAALLLEVPVEVLLERTRGRVECPACHWSGQKTDLGHGLACPKCGAVAGPRADDDEENFRSRHREFRSHTLPAAEHYRARGLLRAVPAIAAQDEVAAAILLAIAPPARADAS